MLLRWCYCRHITMKHAIITFLVTVISAVHGYKNGKECLAVIADSCFSKFTASITCLSEISKSSEEIITCQDATASKICRSLDDALNCTSDFVETSCDFSASNSYLSWMNGFRAVHRKICNDDLSLIQELVDNPSCWNPGKFLTCTEETTNIVHVADLLNTPLSAVECNRVMVSIAICSAKAEKNRIKCRGKATVLVDGLTSFFAESSCMSTITNTMLTDYCSHQAKVQSTIAATLTLLAAGVIVAVIAYFLMTNKVVTVNKRIRLYNDDEDDILKQQSYSAGQH